MHFKIVGRIKNVEVIATGKSIRERNRLWKIYGKGRWRKQKDWQISNCQMALLATLRFTGMKHMESAKRNTKSNESPAEAKQISARFVLCVRNKAYPASLELRKLYRLVADDGAAKRGLIRVIDESGEDYLYPGEYFVPIKLPQSAQKAVMKAI
jgi:hypothetical protein